MRYFVQTTASSPTLKSVMSRLVLSTVALLCTLSVVSATVGWDNCTNTFINGYEPHSPSGAVKICRGGILAISYDVDMIDPAFSGYYITPDDVKSVVPGRANFYEDPDLKSLGITQAKVDSDAFNTSWNRGHLCPSHAMSHTSFSKHTTYTMANVAPQEGYFNQHPWQELEQSVFDWIKDHKALYIITGVAYKDRSKARRTFDNIAVPDYYFKVVCDKESQQSVGVYGDNTDNNQGVSALERVKYIEDEIYGGNLFPADACRTDHLDHSHWWTHSSTVNLPPHRRAREEKLRRAFHDRAEKQLPKEPKAKMHARALGQMREEKRAP